MSYSYKLLVVSKTHERLKRVVARCLWIFIFASRSWIYHEFKDTLIWRKVSLSTYFKAISYYFGLDVKLAVPNLVENSQINRGPKSKGLMRSTVDLISGRIYGIWTCVTSKSNLLFWRLEVAYFREKNELIFLCLCWSCTVDGDPATRPTTQINNITQLRTQNTKSTKADKSNNKAHTLMINPYSFKIFPQFWLAKNTRIIHHN